jgi:hypothetical protein
MTIFKNPYPSPFSPPLVQEPHGFSFFAAVVLEEEFGTKII